MSNRYFLSALMVFALFQANSAWATTAVNSGWGYYASGSLGASSGSLEGYGMESRSFAVYGANAELGIKWGSLRVGFGADYSLWRQLTDPADVSDSNAQGKELSLAPVVGYDFGFCSLMAKYYISSKYTLDKQNASGQDIAFVSPSSAFSIEARIPIRSGKPYIGLSYKKLKYESVEVAGTESTLASTAQVDASAFGLSLGYTF